MRGVHVQGQSTEPLSKSQSTWLNVSESLLNSPLWDNPISKGLLGLIALALAYSVMSSPLSLVSQSVLGLVTVLVIFFLRKIPGRFTTIVMICFSLLMSVRYIWWRMNDTLGFETPLETFFGYALAGAEFYAFVVLVIAYFQTAWPLERKPVPLPKNNQLWPTVDVFITTFNEPLDVVRQSVFSAKSLDWPADKLKVYLLDDGRRDEFRKFCFEAGINYITRENNTHAKAGNLNNALRQTKGEFVAVFDCDHIPARSFLQVCMGWFVKDKNLAMLQTPHVFFSPDPFEKNLETYLRMPNESELFYGIVQDGNDLWNATMFCGSCAIMRRAPLMEIGGVATETVTEDAHTSLKLSRAGYNTCYLKVPQAAGLSTESLSAHVRQRIRWARGLAQIARLDNPFVGAGLSLGQRICYFSSMLHFFYGLPRLIFLTAPLAYVFFGARLFQADAYSIMAYALPSLIVASITNSRVQGKFRYSFWNEVYESVLAWYILLPVVGALLRPSSGGFNVTAKGGVIERSYFDWGISRPYLFLLAGNLAGIVMGLSDFITGAENDYPTLFFNMFWILYNVLILCASLAVASETRQIRANPRVAAWLPASLKLNDGKVITCHTDDFSAQGLGLSIPANLVLEKDTRISVSLYRGTDEAAFPAVVTFCGRGRLGVRFEGLTLEQETELTGMTFSRADAWISTWGQKQQDKPLTAFKLIVTIGRRGFKQLLRNIFHTVFPPRADKAP